MGRLSNIFKSSSPNDDSNGHQVPPPPYNDQEKTVPKSAVILKDRPTSDSGEPSISQIEKPSISDPVPAVPDVLITLKIGPEAKEYHVSKARLCAESKLFRQRFRAGEPHADETSLTYAEFRPRSFDVITHWFDTGELIDYWYEGQTPGDDPAAINCMILYKTLATLQLRIMANHVMDATRKLFLHHAWTVSPALIAWMRSIETENTNLFHCFVDTLVYHLMTFPKYCLADNDALAPQFKSLWDDPALAKVIMEKVLKWQLAKWSDPRSTPGCYYHDHDDGCRRWVKM